MSNRVFIILALSSILTCMVGCRDRQITWEPGVQITFSADSISFDTVFTSFGTSTRTVLLYNHNENAVRISRAWWKHGTSFFANIDGENNTAYWHDMDIPGGDSLFLFVRAQIDPYNANTLPLITDTLCFLINGHTQFLPVQAVGMNVQYIPNTRFYPAGLTLTADKPYLIMDSLVVAGTLTIQPGAVLYMHQSANIFALGNVSAQGTIERPIRILGDRTDYLFPKVPYRMASGQWGGLYLLRTDSLCGTDAVSYNLQHVHLLSGQVGLFCYSDNAEHRAQLNLINSRVHNMSAYGVVLENTDANISNAEISNCASYGLYMCGGNHRIEHTSVANFFGYPYTTLNIHSTPRQSVAAVYILAHSADMADSHSSLYNCIITGAVLPALVVDSIPQSGYSGTVAGSYLSCDSLPSAWAHSNVYAQSNDSVFVNTYYKYNEYVYYDFHLRESSPARGIGLALDSLHLPVQTDMNGLQRNPASPDAGCYVYSDVK